MEFIDKQNELNNYFSKINILYRRLSRKYKISYNEMVILYILKKSTPCTQKDICINWELPKQTVNTIIKNLEKKQYLFFDFADNQKEKIITLSSEGEEYISNIINDIIRMESIAYEKIGEDKCSLVLEIIREFYTYLEEEFENLGGENNE